MRTLSGLVARTGWRLVLVAAALACAGTPPPAPAVAPVEAPAKAVRPAPPACAALVEPGVLRRSSLRHAVEAGLGRWLAGVDVSPERGGGHFQGWRIQRLYPDDPCYHDLDLHPGDVVTRINGAPIERPEQANAIFVALPEASALTVEYQREGEARSLTLAIRND